MKKSLLSFAAMACIAGSIQAQIIVNGGMELWQSISVDQPNGWITSNTQQGNGSPLITASKTSDSHGGTGAIRLETKANGSEMEVGFFSNAENPLSGIGGVPYSQKPANITGYYKSNIATGDSAIVLVVFKKSGVVVSQDAFKLYGTHNTYTLFSFPLSLAVTPDSVIIAAASSNALDEVGVASGSTITIDDLAFTGTGITQPIPGGDFESWLSFVINNLESWGHYGSAPAKTADSYKGNYAAILETVDFGDSNVFGSGLVNGQINGSGPLPGVPYNHAVDTLVFYYKYVPGTGGNDSAVASVLLTKNGMPVGGTLVNLGAAATYTRIALTLIASNTPDSMQINIASSMNGGSQPPVAGSKLWVDEIQLTSEPLNTGIRNIFKSTADLEVYPNPFAEMIWISLPGNAATELSYTLNDITGKVIVSGKGNTIYTDQLTKGIYFITVANSSEIIAVKKVVKQ